MKLSGPTVRKAKPEAKPRKLTDGGGLYVMIHPNGGKYWQLAYRFAGKQKTLALGVYPDVSLALARERREQARKLLTNGDDPAEYLEERRTMMQQWADYLDKLKAGAEVVALRA